MRHWLSRVILSSPVGKVGDRLWKTNEQEFQMPLSTMQKLWITLYLVARDTLAGQYPPAPAQTIEEAHVREREYPDHLAGTSRSEMEHLGLSKPFWGGSGMRRMLLDFCRVDQLLRRRSLVPPARVLELGCGAGWLSEFLARSGYDVLGTTLDPKTVEVAQRRSEAFRALGTEGTLRFQVAAMEQLDPALKDEPRFDAVVIYEALHHVHDWRASLEQAGRMLRPGGVLVIGNEPNRIHTFKAYRVAQLTGTHEIGMSHTAICAHLRTLGFAEIHSPCNRIGLGVRPIWISATRAATKHTSRVSTAVPPSCSS